MKYCVPFLSRLDKLQWRRAEVQVDPCPRVTGTAGRIRPWGMAVNYQYRFDGSDYFQHDGGVLRMAVRYLPILLIVLMLGCNNSGPPPMRVGVNPWVGYDPLVPARELALVDRAARLALEQP